MADTLVDEVLAAWKEGEQLLPSLAPLSADHETVRLAVAELRATYVRLVDRNHQARAHLERTDKRTEKALEAIRDVSVRTSHHR